jgi:hypothetical protein
MQKAAKLLRLAQSDNANEAALAASRAQEIIDRFKLSMDALQMDEAQIIASNEPIQDFGADPLTRDAKLARWKAYLASGIAKQNQCMIYRSGGALKIIGRASDAVAVRYLFSWLSSEVERLANRDCHGYGVTYWNNYRIGAAESICRRLREESARTLETVRTEAAQISSAALVVVNNNALALVRKEQEVHAWAKSNMRLRSSSGGRGSRYDHSARQAGRTAGNSVSLRASGRIGGGSLKLN